LGFSIVVIENFLLLVEGKQVHEHEFVLYFIRICLVLEVQDFVFFSISVFKEEAIGVIKKN